MFWDKGYMPSQNIEALLENENATVEEFLDDEDILQECKTNKKAIFNYFTRADVIKRLIELITTEPSEELPLAQRYRHANMACEILTLGIPSLDEKILEDSESLQMLYSYLKKEPPLNPILSSYFNKTFAMLFTKKSEQDWFLYQQMCLKLLEFIKSQSDFLDLICKHFSTPIIPDLLMQLIKEVEGGQLKRNLYKWLTEEKLVQRLVALFQSSKEAHTHTNVAEFLCDLIQHGRFMRQSEQENDSFEPAFVGSNPILEAIESEDTIRAILQVVLAPDAQESVIVSGISVILTLVKPIVLIEEAVSDRTKFIHNREKHIHEKILTSVIRIIKPHIVDFHEFLKSPPMKDHELANADKSAATAEEFMPPAPLPPHLGRARLQICRLFTVLLQTENNEIIEAICETDFFDTIMSLFKSYCWNNFLHCEVEKCVQSIFQGKANATEEKDSSAALKEYINAMATMDEYSFTKNNNNTENSNVICNDMRISPIAPPTSAQDDNSVEVEFEENKNSSVSTGNSGQTVHDSKQTDDNAANRKNCNDETSTFNKSNDGDINEDINDKDNTSAPQKNANGKSDECHEPTNVDTITASFLQKHVILKCKLISRLLDCWRYNNEMQIDMKRHRLGYMGYLINILKYITNGKSKSQELCALIEDSFINEDELAYWNSITDPVDGDLIKIITTQNRSLANCNAHESGDYGPHSKDFLSGSRLEEDIWTTNLLNSINASSIDLNFDENIDDNTMAGCSNLNMHPIFAKPTLLGPQAFDISCNPWENSNSFSDLGENLTRTKGGNVKEDNTSSAWESEISSNNFADFDAHFSSFSNDLSYNVNLNIDNNKDQPIQDGGSELSKGNKRTDISVAEGGLIDDDKALDDTVLRVMENFNMDDSPDDTPSKDTDTGIILSRSMTVELAAENHQVNDDEKGMEQPVACQSSEEGETLYAEGGFTDGGATDLKTA